MINKENKLGFISMNKKTRESTVIHYRCRNCKRLFLKELFKNEHNTVICHFCGKQESVVYIENK